MRRPTTSASIFTGPSRSLIACARAPAFARLRLAARWPTTSASIFTGPSRSLIACARAPAFARLRLAARRPTTSASLLLRTDGPLLLSAAVETIVVDGLELAQEIRKELSEAVGHHVAAGRRAPHLAVVRVGDDPASASYIKGKRRACESVGIDSTETHLAVTSSPVEVDATI
ncbi:MAG: hypothetical protein E6J87_13885, partial [Deltaproteobacteria bacterium]